MIFYVEGAEYKFKEDCGLNTIILMILNAYVQRTRKSKSPGTYVLVAMQIQSNNTARGFTLPTSLKMSCIDSVLDNRLLLSKPDSMIET